MAPVLAIDRSVTRGLRAGAEERRPPRLKQSPQPGEVEMKPVSSGYADVNGIKLYHEIYGEGEPLVLIHGVLTAIGEMQG